VLSAIWLPVTGTCRMKGSTDVIFKLVSNGMTIDKHIVPRSLAAR
jgi:hypothetical protein